MVIFVVLDWIGNNKNIFILIRNIILIFIKKKGFSSFITVATLILIILSGFETLLFGIYTIVMFFYPDISNIYR